MKQIQAIGTDPGSSFHGLCHLVYRGMRYEHDAHSGRRIAVPDFEPLHWSLANLNAGIVYENDGEWRVVRRHYARAECNDGGAVQSQRSVADNLTRMVADSAHWMQTPYASNIESAEQEELPLLVSEIQCGQIKTGQMDIYAISVMLPVAVRMLDLQSGAVGGTARRLILNGLRKYGFAKKTCDSREARKKLADRITRELLELLGLDGPLRFLDRVVEAQKQDFPGRPAQTHDLCDALLLALYKAMTVYEKRCKRQDAYERQRLAMPRALVSPEPIDLTEYDDDVDSPPEWDARLTRPLEKAQPRRSDAQMKRRLQEVAEEPPKKKQKKKVEVKKTKKRKKTISVDLTFEDEPVKKKRKSRYAELEFYTV